ncbi:glycosyltransferase family 4 protein [Syntrophomonas wolfei]|nr:glycosyltransferase family 4 protein [Syntrophomonas wolfei]
MRIGIFTDSFIPYTSGVVTSILTFQKELSRLGHDIHIFAPSYPNFQQEEEQVYRFFSLPAPTNPDFSLAIPIYPGMNMLVRRLDLDIIHVQSPFTMGRVGLHYGRKYHIPVVFTYHTLYDQYVHYVPIAQDLAREMAIKYSVSFCNHCSHVVVPSSEVETILKQNEVKTPLSVIPTGVPLDKFESGDKEWLRRNYNIPAENRVLLFVGRLSREKNLEFLIKAFRQVKERVANSTLVLTAQGPLESELKKLVPELGLSLERDVVFTGALPFDTLVNVYYSADLFVFSSVTETQGLVLIEAMAAGLPVVAVGAYGVQDMVDHEINGLLTPLDIEAFSDAISSLLLDNRRYRQYQLNARQKAESLSAGKMALKLEQLYQTLYDQSPPRYYRGFDLGRWLGS